MANQWLRLWHDMPTDPKWKTIARVSKRSIPEVMAVYTFVLVDASAAEDRGHAAVNAEDVASALDMETEAVQIILDAMQGRVLDGDKVSGWERRQPSREDGAEGGNKPAAQNYVYYVAATDAGVVKIGISRNPWARIKDLQIGSPNKYELLGVVKTDARSEVSLHKMFAASRVSGEWFKRTAALNLLIDQIKSKDIVDHDQCLSFLEALSPESFTSTVAGYGSSGSGSSSTKDKDKNREDKDKEGKEGGKKLPLITLPTYIEKQKALGQKPIPENHIVLTYAESAGIPQEFLALAWHEFKARYTTSPDDKKKYRDWPGVFHKAVKGNWFKVWFIESGIYKLTTVGQQAELARKSHVAH